MLLTQKYHKVPLKSFLGYTFCCDLIIKALQEHRSLPRHKVNELVLEYLPKGQSEQNKIYKVGNLLSKLKRQGKIFLNDHKEWELSK